MTSRVVHLAQELRRSRLGYRSQVVDQVFVRHSYSCVGDVQHSTFLVSLEKIISRSQFSLRATNKYKFVKARLAEPQANPKYFPNLYEDGKIKLISGPCYPAYSLVSTN